MSSIDPNLVLSPLADPVVNAMYANAEVAGLAMESFINAILATDKEKLNGKITNVTPQSSYISTRNRSCRVDVDNGTDANEKAIIEIQINPDFGIMTRNLFALSHILTGTSTKGDKIAQMVSKMPRVIFINILDYNIREDNVEIVQPYKILYTKEPQKIAIPNFSGYNVQLPRIVEMNPDFTNNLYCWAYTLYTAHAENKTVQEVISMTPDLQEYAEIDAGYQQFCERYQYVSSDPETRTEYRLWFNDRMREEGEKEWIIQTTRNETKKEDAIAFALKLLKRNRPIEEIIEDTDLSLEEVMALQKTIV